MPALKKSKYEAFAHQLAKDLNPKDAAVAAGFAKSQTQASRRAARPEVIERVAELKRLSAWGGSRDVGPLIDALADAIEAAGKLGTASGFVALRGLITEAARLKQMLPIKEPPPQPPMTSEEWLREYSPQQWFRRYGPEAANNQTSKASV